MNVSLVRLVNIMMIKQMSMIVNRVQLVSLLRIRFCVHHVISIRILTKKVGTFVMSVLSVSAH